MKHNPILFIVFNRPQLTEKCLDKILQSNPSKIFISSDGPRNIKESEKVSEVRRIIKSKTKNINVECIFHENNLGCKRAVSYAIKYFFNKVERGIILEDDCHPSQEFFEFCNRMLEIYENNENIVHISGSNPQNLIPNNSCEYFFSKYPRIWGWAGWSRSINNFDVDLKDVSKILINAFKKLDYFQFKLVIYLIYLVKVKKIDTWDYQWCISSMLNGLSIVPKKSLIENVGFGIDASHTKESAIYDSNLINFTTKLNNPITKEESSLIMHECPDLDFKYIKDIFTKFYRFQKWM